MKQEVTMYPFSSAATENPHDILNGKSPIEFLKSKYTKGCIFGLDNLQREGVYKYMGWVYDFSPYLKKFLVKQYGQWNEYYAVNKTALRNSIYGSIEEIIQKG